MSGNFLARRNRGIANLTFNGISTAYEITHGLGYVPGYFDILPLDSTDDAVLSVKYTADDTRIYLNFSTPPMAGNCLYSYEVIKGDLQPQEYYLRQVAQNNPFPPMDGVELEIIDNKITLFLGWNDTSGTFTPGPSTNHVWSTANGGRESNWSQDADLAMPPTHNTGHGHGLRSDGNVWFWGIDDGLNTPKSYKWNATTGAVLVNSDTGLGIRHSSLNRVIDDWMYTLGGQTNPNLDGSTPFSSIYKTMDGINQVYVGPTPEPFMSACTMWRDVAGNIYIAGGGKLCPAPAVYDYLIQYIYKSTDGGASWAIYATLPPAMRGLWADACAWNDMIWWCNGYRDGVNQPGIYYTTDFGLNWVLFSTAMPARHLTGVIVDPVSDTLNFICGNLRNDHWRIEKITYPVLAFDPDVKERYRKLYPADRPTMAELIRTNDFVIGCKADTSVDGLSSNWDCLDRLSLFAGFSNQYQALMPLKTTNTAFLNQPRKINAPQISYTGVKGNGIQTPGLGSGLALRWSPTLHGVEYQDNFASCFVYSGSSLKENTVDYGNYKSSIFCCQTNNQFYGRINGTPEVSVTATSGEDYRGLTRVNSTTIELWLADNFTTFTENVDPGGLEWAICGTLDESNPNNIRDNSSKSFYAEGAGNGSLDHVKMRARIKQYLAACGL